MFRGQLSRSSLGQLANIGDLYDARTDHFTGHSIITGSTECLNISNMPMESYREEFLIDSTSYDRLALLVNDRDLQLSVAIGLVEPERNIAGLIDQDDIILSPKNGIILRTVTTLLEQVHSIADIKHLVAACDLTNSEATHVVVGVVRGATVAVCLDHIDIWSEQTGQDDLQQQLQKLMPALKSGARPDFQALCHVKSAYTIRCFSNGLSQINRPYRSSLEDAVELLSNLPRLTHSVNFDKVFPVTFILMPLPLLSKSTSSKYRRVEGPILTETLAHFRDVQITKHDFGYLPQSLEGRKVYFQEGETDKIYQFLTGFQQAEKTLYKDVANAVDEVRSGRLDQSQLLDITRTFSCGGYSKDSLKAFHDSIEPMLQKLMFFDKLQ